MSKKPVLIVVIGPTAIGKTELSLRIAETFGCDILSCDSRQFFKEIPIGTAAPTSEELSRAKHYFVGNKSIQDSYTVGDFEKDALKTLNDIYQSKNIAVLVGGSGLYVDAVIKGLDEFPDVDDSVRDAVKSDYESFGLSYLQEQVAKLDPEYYAKVDQSNPQRLMRALEICRGTGNSFSSFRQNKLSKRDFETIIIGLEAPRELVYDRINQRVDLMIQNGLLEEAKAVYPFKELNALQTVGFRELFNYFDGNTTLEEAINLIKQNSRRFAKRQITWFKRTENTNWFSYNDTENILSFLKKST